MSEALYCSNGRVLRAVLQYSKLRSDELLTKDARAHVLVAPPGADPKEYTQQRGGGRGRGRGGRRRGGRGGAAKMDVDR